MIKKYKDYITTFIKDKRSDLSKRNNDLERKIFLMNNHISNYTITESGISVDDDVIILHNYDKLPFKFDKINGHFTCRTGITTTENLPNVIKGHLFLNNNKISDVTYMPTFVDGEINLQHNLIESIDVIKLNSRTNLSNNPLYDIDSFLPYNRILSTPILGFICLLIDNELNDSSGRTIYRYISKDNNIGIHQVQSILLDRLHEFNVIKHDHIDLISLEQLYEFYDSNIINSEYLINGINKCGYKTIGEL